MAEASDNCDRCETPMIRVRGLHKAFDGHAVLRGVDFCVPQGKFYALIGMSGLGKSVLLKHIAGLMRPDRGTVEIGGTEITRARRRVLREVRRRIAFLFQGGALFDSMTVYENVAFPLKERKLAPAKEIPERVMAELRALDIQDAAEKYPAQLSGGMLKRAALARCLVMEPEIMLFDEPTTGLDPIIAHSVLTLIDDCRRRLGFTGIIVTHRIPRVFSIVDCVALFHEGRIRSCGAPESLERSPDAVVQRFLQEAMASVADLRSPQSLRRPVEG